MLRRYLCKKKKILFKDAEINILFFPEISNTIVVRHTWVTGLFLIGWYEAEGSLRAFRMFFWSNKKSSMFMHDHRVPY